MRPKSYKPKLGFDIRISKPDQKTKQKKEAPKQQRCQAPGCVAEALSQAPKSRDRMDERVWLCREHLRSHNESWDFFAGMSEEDIRRHTIEAIVGHRPTWPLGRRGAGSPSGPRPSSGRYEFSDGFAVFEDAAEPARPAPKRRLTKGQMDALNILNLSETASLQEVKARYKELVKRFHPDTNGGDRGSEERLKQVIKAFGHLRTSGFT